MRFHQGVQYYELTNLPGCSQVIVSHDLFISPESRKQGLSYQAGLARINHIESLGYNYALCTVAGANEAEIKQLRYNDWRWLEMFTSSKTGHDVQLWGRKVR